MSSHPWRTAASIPTLILAVPITFCRSAAGRWWNNSKHGTETTRAETPSWRRNLRASMATETSEPEAAVRLTVTNTATVPVSVTSHFHFFEANPRLDFPRERAYGMRLAVPAGSSVRFGPGESVEVGLVPIGGARIAIGFAGLVDGPLDAPGARAEALRRAAACGYLGATRTPDQEGRR